MQLHPEATTQRVFSTKVHTNNHQAPRLVTRFGLKTTTPQTTQTLTMMNTTLY